MGGTQYSQIRCYSLKAFNMGGSLQWTRQGECGILQIGVSDVGINPRTPPPPRHTTGRIKKSFMALLVLNIRHDLSILQYFKI